jgi:hypothetical protein
MVLQAHAMAIALFQFAYALAFNQDIVNWNVGTVDSMGFMVRTIVSLLQVATGMKRNKTQLTLGRPSFSVQNHSIKTSAYGTNCFVQRLWSRLFFMKLRVKAQISP